MTARWIGGLVAASLLLARPGFGQTTGSIEGRVSDSDSGAIPGVVVSATSPNLQGVRSTISDRNGTFRFPAVPPGEYRVLGALTGFRVAETVVTVRLDGTARIDLVLEPLQTEELLVSGRATGIDLTSTTAGTSYPTRVITRLPVSRNYADIVRSNPGVSTDRGDTYGRSLALTIYGATSNENQWIIDGVNTTSVFRGVQGKDINNEFVQEVEVKTGGYQAEYGRAFGGVVNVITKSGGNEFHGDAFAYYDATGTAADKAFEIGDSGVASMRIADGSRLDYGAALGGYILRDRLWFFGAFNRVELQADLSRVESSALVSKEDRFPFDTAEDLYSIKLTWNAAPSTSAVGTVFADPSTTSGAAGADPRQGLTALFVTPIVSPDPSTWYSARDQGGTDFGLRLARLFGSTAIATLQGSYHEDKNALTAPDGIRYEDWTCAGGTPASPCRRPVEPNDVRGGYGQIVALADGGESSRRQYRGDVTLYSGNHEIKGGGEYSEAETEAIGSFTGGQRVEIANEHGQLYYLHVFNAVSPEDPTPVDRIYRRGSVEDFGVYLQDSWRAAPGLTINAGLRWDGENTFNYAGDAVLRLRTAWQPRIGLVWDPWKSGATKVFAFAGRFSYAMTTGQAVAMFGDFTGLFTYNFDPVDVVQDPNVIGHDRQVIAAGGGLLGSPVDSDVVAPYQDELTIGIERSVGSSSTVGLKGTYRRLGSAIESRCDLDRASPETDFSRCAIITPGSSGRFSSGDVPTCDGIAAGRSGCATTGPATPPARRLYRGIEVFGRHSIGDRVWLQASYVHSSLRGNYDGGVNQTVGRSIPGRNEDFDFPALWHSGYGTLALDRPHRFRLDGYAITPWRLSVGLQAFVESGPPLNRLGYFNPAYSPIVFLVPRGSEGRLPTLWDANATASYPVAIGPLTVTLQIYVYNVFNNQIATSRDDAWSSSPPAGFPATIFDPDQERTNENYGKITGRSDPRSFRAALRVSF